MYNLKGFIRIDALVNNSVDINSVIGEPSIWSQTFSREVGEYTNTTYQGFSLLSMYSKDTVIGDVPVSEAFATHVLQVSSFIYSYAVTQGGAINGVDFYDDLRASFFGTMTGMYFGPFVGNGFISLPEFVVWTNPALPENSLKIWFSDSAFRSQYDSYEITVVAPINNLNDFFFNPNTIKQLVTSRSISQTIDLIQVAKGKDPETVLRTNSYDYVNPAFPSFTFPTLWSVLIYGPAGDNNDAIKDAIIEYILDNSTYTREEWTVILPSLFKRTEFVIIPRWDLYAIPNMSVQAGIYSPVINLKQSTAFAKTKIGDYPSKFIENNITAFGITYRSLALLCIGSPQNRDNKFKIIDFFPDYIDVGTQSLDFNRMELASQEWSDLLEEMVIVAESADRFSTLPANMRRVIRDGIFYIASVYNDVQYLVLAKSSILDNVGLPTSEPTNEPTPGPTEEPTPIPTKEPYDALVLPNVNITLSDSITIPTTSIGTINGDTNLEIFDVIGELPNGLTLALSTIDADSVSINISGTPIGIGYYDVNYIIIGLSGAYKSVLVNFSVTSVLTPPTPPDPVAIHSFTPNPIELTYQVNVAVPITIVSTGTGDTGIMLLSYLTGALPLGMDVGLSNDASGNSVSIDISGTPTVLGDHTANYQTRGDSGGTLPLTFNVSIVATPAPTAAPTPPPTTAPGDPTPSPTPSPGPVPVKDTFISQKCVTLIENGITKANVLRGTYADGTGGTYTAVIEYDSTTCGYVAPTPPPSATPAPATTYTLAYSKTDNLILEGTEALFHFTTSNKAMSQNYYWSLRTSSGGNDLTNVFHPGLGGLLFVSSTGKANISIFVKNIEALDLRQDFKLIVCDDQSYSNILAESPVIKTVERAAGDQTGIHGVIRNTECLTGLNPATGYFETILWPNVQRQYIYDNKGGIVIKDVPNSVACGFAPTYTIVPTKTSYRAGETLSFKVWSNNPVQETLTYTLSLAPGDISSGLFDARDMTQGLVIDQVFVSSGTANTLVTHADSFSFYNRPFERQFVIRLFKVFNATTAEVATISPKISIFPPPPTYDIDCRDSNGNPLFEQKQGVLITYKITTNYILGGKTTLYGTIDGTDIMASDFVDNKLSLEFPIVDNAYTLAFTPEIKTSSIGKLFTVNIRTGSVNGPIVTTWPPNYNNLPKNKIVA